jgi:2-oxoisovalerate dehydrogenase E1 component
MPLVNAEHRSALHNPRLLRRAVLIRRFEEMLLRLFSEGKLNGTVHTCIGQEWSALAVVDALLPEDTIFSNHRGHGHFLSAHNDPRGLLAEIMGREIGICGGIGGSQHLFAKGFFSNGILGGMSPVAAGFSLAQVYRGNRNIAVIFHGDGALGEEVVYESMNWAAKWDIPLLWVIERNGVAQSTECGTTLSGTIEARAAAFDIPYFKGDTWNVDSLFLTAKEAVEHVRRERTPALLEIGTYRLAAHSKGDDDRDPSELERYSRLDPLNKLFSAPDAELLELDREIASELSEIFIEAESASKCRYAPSRQLVLKDIDWSPLPAFNAKRAQQRYSELINQSFLELFSKFPELLMIGEDIEAPYGGAFKVTRDLSTRFPGRVRNTPISEAALVGIGTGLALAGMRPIVEIMFGDFLGLAFDQLLQHACKFEDMYNGAARIPLIVRTPMGGRRGYGPTHSQSIEGYFIGMPHLLVIALNCRLDPHIVYSRLLSSEKGPALVLENKILYTRTLRTEPPQGFETWYSDERYPTLRLSPSGSAPDVTIVCYGGMLELAEDVLATIFTNREVLCEIICAAQLSPLDIAPIVYSVKRTGRLVVLEEGKTFASYSSEIIARLSEARVPFQVKRLGYDHMIPASLELERSLLPNVDSICAAIEALLDE